MKRFLASLFILLCIGDVQLNADDSDTPPSPSERRFLHEAIIDPFADSPISCEFGYHYALKYFWVHVTTPAANSFKVYLHRFDDNGLAETKICVAYARSYPESVLGNWNDKIWIEEFKNLNLKTKNWKFEGSLSSKKYEYWQIVAFRCFDDYSQTRYSSLPSTYNITNSQLNTL